MKIILLKDNNIKKKIKFMLEFIASKILVVNLMHALYFSYILRNFSNSL